jgi:COX assembly protein 1
MNTCMKAHATAAEQDAAREEWFATRAAAQRELKMRKARQQEDFIREWWGLPEADREKRAKEAEAMRRAERVHGQVARRPPAAPGEGAAS